MSWGITGWGTGYWGAEGLYPLITNLSPACGSINRANDFLISFSVSDPNLLGIDLAETKVEVRVSGSVSVLVFTGAAFHADWNLNSSVSPVVGPPPGYDFVIGRDVAYPDGSTITITITTKNTIGLSAQQTCSFTVRRKAELISAELISIKKVKISFSTPIYNGDVAAQLLTPGNWSIYPITGNAVHSALNQSKVLRVVAENRYNARYAILDVIKMVPNQRYEVSLHNVTDIFGQTYTKKSVVAFEARNTKVDAVLSRLPKTWDKTGFSNLFWVVAALSIESEKVGGSQGTIVPGFKELF